jgi:1,2-diacylglycerol 3-alpha-glucosyltransferase
MRVGLFSDTFPPEINGVAMSVMTLQQVLLKMGHDVFVVTTHPSLLHVQKDGNILRLPGIEIKKLYGYVLSNPFHPLAINDVRNMNLDVIHVHTEFGVGIYARLCAQILRIPIISTYHTTYEDYSHYINPFNSKSVEKLAKKAIVRLSKMAGDSCLSIIAPSEKTKLLLEGYHIRKPIDVIPTGIDLERFKPYQTSEETITELKTHLGITDQFVLLFVGRIAEEKSIDMVIKALPKVISVNPQLRLVIVGGGPQMSEYQQLTSELGLNEYVIFTGKKQATDVPRYYHMANAFVSASTSETQGITYIEALASSTVVFARDPEVVSDLVFEDQTGYLFTDADELSEKLIKFMSLSPLQQQLMSAKCEEVVKVYDSKYFGERVVEVYHKVIDQYRELYRIDKITFIRDYMALSMHNKINKVKLLVSIKTYYELKLKKDMVITQEMFKVLEQEHQMTAAYQLCIRRLQRRDATVVQIRELLSAKTKLDQEQIDIVVNRLSEQGLIDDYRYVNDFLNSRTARVLGQKRIINYLKNKGIAQSLLDKLPQSSAEQEHALEVAQKTSELIQGQSVVGKKYKIRQKLMVQGFDQDIIDQTMEKMDFKDDQLHEVDNLRALALKAYQRYAKKYQGSELRNHVFRHLSLKGYKYEDIYVILDNMEWKNEN